LDAKNPKYKSNLSAVLFEQGKYVEAIATVKAAWGLLEGSDGGSHGQKPLATKLATRFSKGSYFLGEQPTPSSTLEAFLAEAPRESEMAKHWEGVKEKEKASKPTQDSIVRAQNSSVCKAPMYVLLWCTNE
jgi:hypothetical protein